MSVVRDIPKGDPFWAAYWKYVEEVWGPAVKRNPTQYNYWRSPANVRMGKFKIVRSEGQEVFEE